MEKVEKIKDNEEKIKIIDSSINDIFYNDEEEYDQDQDQEFEEYEQFINDPNYQASELEENKKKLIMENRMLRTEIEHEQFDENFKKLSKTFKSGVVASDIENNMDTLSRELYAKILVRHITKKAVHTPINIGVFGEWGEGKSSFLRLMENEIKMLNEQKFNHISKTYIIRYDASQYDEQTKIWTAILSVLFKEFERAKGIKGKMSFAWFKIDKSFKVNRIKYYINSLILAITIGWLVLFSMKDNPIYDNINIFGFAGIIPLTLFVTNILIPFIKKQLAFIQPLSSMIISHIELPDYKINLGLRENIKESLDDLLNVWINKNDERIVIFVDELDRCSEKTISEFFNALQLFLSVKGITVILSVNYKTVCYSLANSNKHYFDNDINNKKKIDFGINYLRKYISIPIYLPNTNTYIDYINNIFESINNQYIIKPREIQTNYEKDSEIGNDNNYKMFEETEISQINKILEISNKYSHITPREIKNIINILVISKEICVMSNQMVLYNKSINFGRYIKWFLYSYFNRSTAKKLVEELIRTKKSKYNNVKECIDEISNDIIKEIYDEHEKMAKDMIKLLFEISVEEIIIFKDISCWFINTYDLSII